VKKGSHFLLANPGSLFGILAERRLIQAKLGKFSFSAAAFSRFLENYTSY
jgi:hypothetical protein